MPLGFISGFLSKAEYTSLKPYPFPHLTLVLDVVYHVLFVLF